MAFPSGIYRITNVAIGDQFPLQPDELIPGSNIRALPDDGTDRSKVLSKP